MADGLLQNPGAVTVEDPDQISQGAQDVAKAQGVAYEDIAKSTQEQDPVYEPYDASGVSSSLETQVDFKPGESYIDDKSTVSGQLNELLSGDSEYIQNARQQGTEQAASRGLLNSSFGAGAAQREAIAQATPIAAQDAQTYAGFKQREQSADYNLETIQGEAIVSGEMVEHKAKIDQNAQNIQNQFASQLQAASAQDKVWLTDLQNTYNTGLQNLDSINKQQMLELELDANQVRDVSTAASEIMMNYQVSVEKMLTDPDFLNLGASAVNNAVNQLQTLAANSIQFIGASQGINMDPFVDAYLSDLEVLQ